MTTKTMGKLAAAGAVAVGAVVLGLVPNPVASGGDGDEPEPGGRRARPTLGPVRLVRLTGRWTTVTSMEYTSKLVTTVNEVENRSLQYSREGGVPAGTYVYVTLVPPSTYRGTIHCKIVVITPDGEKPLASKPGTGPAAPYGQPVTCSATVQ